MDFGMVLEAKIDSKIDLGGIFEGVFSHPYF